MCDINYTYASPTELLILYFHIYILLTLQKEFHF